MKKKPSMEFLNLSFAVTILKIAPVEKCDKTTLKLFKMAYPALGNPPGAYSIYPNQMLPEPIKHCLQNRN